MNKTTRSLFAALMLCSAVFGLLSCKKEYSADTPLPDVYKSSVIVSSNNRIIYALDRETGKRIWEFQAASPVYATPVMFLGVLYVATTGGELYKIDAQYGTEIQMHKFASGIYATPIAAGDRLIVCTYQDMVHAVKPNDIDSVFWSTSVSGQVMASPAVHTMAGRTETGIFVATVNNKIVTLDLEDGSAIWTFTPPNDGAFYSSPCVVNDNFLYIGNDNGRVYSVLSPTGSLDWQFATDGQVRSSPIMIGGNVLVGSNDRYLYSIDSTTGLERWKVLTGDRIVSSPAVDNQYVYFGCYDFNFYCVDIIDGTIKWKKQTFGLIKSSPAIYQGTVYFGGFDKNLYAVDTSDGGTKWVFNVNGQMETSPIIDTIGGAIVPSISGSYPF